LIDLSVFSIRIDKAAINTGEMQRYEGYNKI